MLGPKGCDQSSHNKSVFGFGSNDFFTMTNNFLGKKILSIVEFGWDCKRRSTLVQILPKITVRWRQMEFCIFCAKSRQNERRSVVLCLNVNKLSQIFSGSFFFLCVCEKSHQNERSSALCSLNVNKVSRTFS